MKKDFRSCTNNVYAKEIPYTSEELNEVFTYKDGKLYHKNYRNRIKAGPNLEGKEAGRPTVEGRYQIRISYSLYYRSRLIWKLLNGNDPVGVIDHFDKDPTNDKIENLQDISQGENIRRKFIK